MSDNYEKIAKEVIEAVGGADNIISAAYCATRLRLILKDRKKADDKVVEGIDKVKGFFFTSGQYQIIFGTGTVNKVFEQVSALGISGTSKSEQSQMVAEQGDNKFKRGIRIFSDIFVPIIPAMVATGLFMGLRGLLLQQQILAQTKWNIVNPVGSCAIVAQAGAAFAVGMKSKSKKIKALSFPSVISALLGITEPAIFGVNLRFVKPFIMGLVGGGVGGFLTSVFKLKATGMGISALPGMLLFLNNQFILYILVIAISFGVAFVLTFMFGYKDKEEQ